MSQPSITAYLSLRDAGAAMDFYARAFGATDEGVTIRMPDGTIAHAELRIGETVFYLAEAKTDWGNPSPEDLGDTAVRLALHVADADAAFERAVAAGCTVLIPLADQFYGERSGRLRDPFGHVWLVSQTIEEMSSAEMQARLDAMTG